MVSAALPDVTVKVVYQVMGLLFVMGGKSWVVEEVAVGWLPASIATKRADGLVGVVACHNNYSAADAAADNNNAAVGD